MGSVVMPSILITQEKEERERGEMMKEGRAPGSSMASGKVCLQKARAFFPLVLTTWSPCSSILSLPALVSAITLAVLI